MLEHENVSEKEISIVRVEFSDVKKSSKEKKKANTTRVKKEEKKTNVNLGKFSSAT